MTQPDPAGPPVTGEPNADTTTAPTSGPSATDTTDWKAEAEKWKAFSRKNEDSLKAAREQHARVLADAGLNPDGTPLVDHEAAAAELRARAERAEGQAWANGTRSEIHRLAPKLGGDSDALLDSDDFKGLLDDLVDMQPNTPAFRAALEPIIRDFIVQNPRFRSRSGPARVGADITGSGGGGNERPKSLREAFNRKANT